jgi:hypothetical protein
MLFGDCWYTDTPSCGDISEECAEVQLTQRLLLTLSNLTFVVPVLLLIYRHNKIALTRPLSPSEEIFIISCISMCVVSTAHHMCADDANRVPCYSFCIMSAQTMYNVDALCAGLLVHASATLHWEPKSEENERYRQLTVMGFFLLLPVAGLYIDSTLGIAYLLFVVTLFVVDWTVRFTHDELILNRHFQIPLVTGICVILVSILLQYAEEASLGPYSIEHTAWHTGLSVALCCAVYLYRLNNNEEERVRKNEYAAAYLHSLAMETATSTYI